MRVYFSLPETVGVPPVHLSSPFVPRLDTTFRRLPSHESDPVVESRVVTPHLFEVTPWTVPRVFTGPE